MKFFTKPWDKSSFKRWLLNDIRSKVQCSKIFHFQCNRFRINDFALLFWLCIKGSNRPSCSPWKPSSIQLIPFFNRLSIYSNKTYLCSPMFILWEPLVIGYRSFSFLMRNGKLLHILIITKLRENVFSIIWLMAEYCAVCFSRMCNAYSKNNRCFNLDCRRLATGASQSHLNIFFQVLSESAQPKTLETCIRIGFRIYLSRSNKIIRLIKKSIWKWPILKYCTIDRISFNSHLLKELLSHGFVKNFMVYLLEKITSGYVTS